jgi:hypothetical protein
MEEMSARFVNIDHDTPLPLPPDLRDWLSEDHMVHFIMDSVKALDLSRALQQGGEPRLLADGSAPRRHDGLFSHRVAPGDGGFQPHTNSRPGSDLPPNQRRNSRVRNSANEGKPQGF